MPSKTPSSRFRLKFNPTRIPKLVNDYNPSDDLTALKAGKAIRSGAYTLRDVEEIFRWKTKGRGISRLCSNTEAEIRDALTLATAAKTERAAMSVLRGLQGVDTPVASAFLMAIDPKRYTVIDFRALEALGYEGGDRSVNLYLNYLNTCRELAKKHKVSLRDLDRALWQWSREQEQN